MSQLIDQQEHIIKQQNLQTTFTTYQSTKLLTQQIYANFPHFTLLSVSKTCIRFVFTVYQSKIQSELNIYVFINISLQIVQLFCHYSQNNLPIAIKDNLSSGILKRFFTKTSMNTALQPRISIDPNNGILQYRFMSFCTKNILKSGKNFFNFLSVVVSSFKINQNLIRKKIFQPCNLLPIIYQDEQISMKNSKKEVINVYANYEDAKFQIICKYVSLSTTTIDCSKVGQHKDFIFKINKLKQQNPLEIQTRHLYCFDIRNQLNKVEPINYIVNEQDEKRLNKALEVKIFSKLKPGQNKYIFNFIKILEPQKVNPRPYKVGGFSVIMLTQLKFQYVKTCLIMREIQDHQLFLRENRNNRLQIQSDDQQQKYKKFSKWICIKLPRYQSNFNQQFDREINIVKLFRTTHSPYILKYYTSDQINFNYKDKLLADACNMPSLSQFLEKTTFTLSIQNKLQILLHIIKSIVFLERNKIVHMDLKPANILIAQNYLIKLIDFGQAYNESVCGSDYFPGHSFPYAPPESFTPKNRKFSSKSDVFSFGVIMYEILLQKRPFQYVQKLKDIYKNKKQLTKIFLNHQSLQSRFSDRVLNILLLVITKCLDSDESKRPEPSWIALILYMCLTNMRQNW